MDDGEERIMYLCGLQEEMNDGVTNGWIARVLRIDALFFFALLLLIHKKCTV